jgi:hypothetical protein
MRHISNKASEIHASPWACPAQTLRGNSFLRNGEMLMVSQALLATLATMDGELTVEAG